MKFLKNLIVIGIALLVFAVAAVAIFYFVKNKEKKEITTEVRKNTNGKYVTLNLGQTHYELDGQDTGKVVILIHGFSVPYYIWDGTYEYLVEHGFRVLRYDMYGRGFSDRPDVLYNRKLYIDQITEMMEQLHLQKPVNLVGVSFGGTVAADFAVEHPELVNKVVLIDPAYNMLKPRWPDFVMDVKEVIGAENRANGQMDDFIYPDLHPDWIKQYEPQMEYKGFRRALVSTTYNYYAKGKDTYKALKATNKPVFLIWGREDKTVPFMYSDSVRSVLQPQFLPVDETAHLPHLEKPEIVNPAIVTFLNK